MLLFYVIFAILPNFLISGRCYCQFFGFCQMLCSKYHAWYVITSDKHPKIGNNIYPQQGPFLGLGEAGHSPRGSEYMHSLPAQIAPLTPLHPWQPQSPQQPSMPMIPPRSPQCPNTLLALEYLHSLPAQQCTADTPYTP